MQFPRTQTSRSGPAREPTLEVKAVPSKVTIQVKLARDAQANIVDERLRRRIKAVARRAAKDLPSRLAASLNAALQK
ncbi:MAG TPA: hypothetical protein VF773_05765 [Verrucomicrobiae bacterium]